MITRILTSSALSLAMFVSIASAADTKITHKEPASSGNKCTVGFFDTGSNECIVPGRAPGQKLGMHPTADGKGHYEAAEMGGRCNVGVYDTGSGECIVPGPGPVESEVAAPDSLGGASASGTTKPSN